MLLEQIKFYFVCINLKSDVIKIPESSQPLSAKKYQSLILRTTETNEDALELGHNIVRKIN